MEFTSQKQKSYLLLKAVGPISEEGVIAMGAEIVKRCEEENLKGTIVDCGGITGALPPMDLYHATNKFIDIVGDIRVAYINPPKEWIPDDDQFSRDVAYNRGGALELFTSLEDAENWLNS